MIVKDAALFSAQLPSTGRLLGLDLGEKTIGLALSDSLRSIASPLETLARGKFSADSVKLQALKAKYELTGLVLGYPINMDGTEGPRCQATRAYATLLAPKLELPILLWDERMSTMAVNRMMLDADLSRARRGELVDKLASSYMLQGVLDILVNLG